MPLIECLLGSVSTTVGSDTYSFHRDEHGRFVADVHNQSHIECFLARDDAYRTAGDVVVEPELPTSSIETLLGSNILPSMVPISDTISVQLGEVVARAHSESGLSIEDWNAQSDEDREAALSLTVEAMQIEAAPPAPAPEPAPEPLPEPVTEPAPETPAVLDKTDAAPSPAAETAPRRGRRRGA
ncbi:hypothetical protein [Rhizobium sp. 18065]|uniref:hypothetical protein n=1 Tax=Rhizobium sp. 18065 TaxID=2681411 RepID=UPI00135807EC|nr:hypothetical protein [Rhizobium sp. 18065]